MASPNGASHTVLEGVSPITADDTWAVGIAVDTAGVDRTLAEHWNGTTWTMVPTPNVGVRDNELFGVRAVSSNDVWAVGAYSVNYLNYEGSLAEHWDGTSWTVVTTAVSSVADYFFGVDAISSTDVWAVGTQWDAIYQVFNPLIEHFDGTTWAVSPNVYQFSNWSSVLYAVSAWSATDVWAVGSLSYSPDPKLWTLAMHWAGGLEWGNVSSGNTITGDNEYFGVTALEADHAVAVGYGGYIANSSPGQATAFGLVASGLPTSDDWRSPYTTTDNALESVARSSGTLWAVGYNLPNTMVLQGSWNSATHHVTWASPGIGANPSTVNNQFIAVAALSPVAFWATGFETSGTVDHTLAEVNCSLKFGVSGPPKALSGVPFSMTVTAENADSSTNTTYGGTVHFASSDSQATLPADYTFVPGDVGTHTFNGVVLKDVRDQPSEVTAADPASPLAYGTLTITVSCLGACQSPGGTPGGRGGSTGSSGTPGGRGGSPAPPAPPGPRLPIRSGSGLSGLTPPSVGIPRIHLPASAIAAPSRVAVAAPSTSRHLIGSEPRPRRVRGAAPTYAMTVAAAVSPTTPRRDPAPWYVLALLPVVIVFLGLFVRRRQLRP